MTSSVSSTKYCNWDQCPTRSTEKYCNWDQCPTRSTDNPTFESSLKKCSSCKKVWYCDVKCQQKDWPKHKVICFKKTEASESQSDSSEKGFNELQKGVFECFSKTMDTFNNYNSIRKILNSLGKISEKPESIYPIIEKTILEGLFEGYKHIMDDVKYTFEGFFGEACKKMSMLNKKAEEREKYYSVPNFKIKELSEIIKDLCPNFPEVKRVTEAVERIIQAKMTLAKFAEETGAIYLKIHGEGIFLQSLDSLKLVIRNWVIDDTLSTQSSNYKNNIKSLELFGSPNGLFSNIITRSQSENLCYLNLSKEKQLELFFKTMETAMIYGSTYETIRSLVSKGYGVENGKISEVIEQKINSIRDSDPNLAFGIYMEISFGLKEFEEKGQTSLNQHK